MGLKLMREVTFTRSAVLELMDEHRLMHQGYHFLDEKRVLLATEMLRQLRAYQGQLQALDDKLMVAKETLASAVVRHGLDHLEVYPVPSKASPIPERTRRVFVGVALLEVTPLARSTQNTTEPLSSVHSSPEAEACRTAFEQLWRAAAEIGARASNLRRLARDYRRTERRAKALENVLLPEIQQAIRQINEQLDTMEREDAVRARWSCSAVA